ncbi:hypothetical protein NPIL_155391 [Nephila pilipes]|uniref:Uncharacterized protein n=1 Tax=Nephila pilipes TaxID=299642 RepID=A0A8X6T927_NEPPI|nr:hypothetical protein NPIL_155391 [Nephila pilipes]
MPADQQTRWLDVIYFFLHFRFRLSAEDINLVLQIVKEGKPIRERVPEQYGILIVIMDTDRKIMKHPPQNSVGTIMRCGRNV